MAFLLNQNFCVCDISVDVACVAQFHALFKLDVIGRAYNAEHVAQKPNPKPLRLLFFVAFVFPKLRELRRSLSPDYQYEMSEFEAESSGLDEY